LAAKTPTFRYWISLDFLGISRPNRDLSMGCAGFSAQNFSCAFPGVRGAPRGGACGRGYAKEQFCSWGELNQSSDFLQLIVAVNRPPSSRII
jgi:hypothetical protein